MKEFILALIVRILSRVFGPKITQTIGPIKEHNGKVILIAIGFLFAGFFLWLGLREFKKKKGENDDRPRKKRKRGSR